MIKYLLYKLNLALLFKGNTKKIDFNKFNIESFFSNFNKQSIIASNFNLRSEADYLDCLFLKNKNSNFITIYFHGNRGNIYDCILKNDIKNIITYSSIFIFDYRGYGNSTGYSDKESIITDTCVAYYFVMNILDYTNDNIIF
jgi:hypothetical protein